MATLAAGRLRHRVVIEESVNIIDSEGMQVESWEVFAEVWAAVEPLSAREFVAGQAVQSNVIGKVIMRYRPGLKAAMRILHRGQYFNIAGVIVDNVSGIEWATLPYSQGVNEG